MTKTEPWRALPASVAELMEPELDAITDEILATIAREVPEYARPFEGSFGRGVRPGVTEALRQFVDLIRSPSGARGPGREVYVALGRGELRQGRTLDSLQSAYRVGARVAWRRVAEAARRAGLDPEAISLLAESIFALVERIAARQLAPLRELTPKARARMEETALAYLRERGNAAAMARALGVHPQTARYRLPRLRELLGEELDDPDVRFELELALRGKPPPR